MPTGRKWNNNRTEKNEFSKLKKEFNTVQRTDKIREEGERELMMQFYWLVKIKCFVKAVSEAWTYLDALERQTLAG